MSLPEPTEQPVAPTPETDASAEKSAVIPPGTLVPALNGGMIRHGSTPGSNGPGTGRPRRAFKEFARELAEDPDLQESIRKRAQKQATVLKMVLDHGAGVPVVPIDMQHSVDPGALERLFARLAPAADPQIPPAATADPTLPPAE